MRHDIHVRLHADIGSHRVANGLRAARGLRLAVHFIDAHDRRIWVIHRRCGVDVLRIERARQPKIAELGRGSAHGCLPPVEERSG
jgi:hypothetical protein